MRPTWVVSARLKTGSSDAHHLAVKMTFGASVVSGSRPGAIGGLEDSGGESALRRRFRGLACGEGPLAADGDLGLLWGSPSDSESSQLIKNGICLECSLLDLDDSACAVDAPVAKRREPTAFS